MITRLRVDGFRTFVGFDAQFPQIVLLGGPNGGGKTSVLDVVEAVQRLVVGGATASQTFPPTSRTRWSLPSLDRQRVELEVRSGDRSFVYTLVVAHSDAPGRLGTWIEEEHVDLDGTRLYSAERGTVSLFGDDAAAKPRTTFPADRERSFLAVLKERGDNQLLHAFRDAVGGFWVLQPAPPLVRGAGQTRGEWLERDCANLEPWLRGAFAERPSEVATLVDDLAGPLPGLVNLSYPRGAPHLHLDVDGERGKYTLQLAELSDGQIQLIALYATARFELLAGRTFLFDEPDIVAQRQHRVMTAVERWRSAP